MEFLLYHLALLGIAILLTQSLSAVWRVGIFSLGHHGFFAVGAYSAAALLAGLDTHTWPRPGGAGLLAGLCVAAASLAAGALCGWTAGRLVAGLTGRLRHDYLAVATLIFAEVVQALLSNFEFLGGALGFEAPPVVARSGAARVPYAVTVALLTILLNLTVHRAVRLLERSPYGLFIVAASENELAAELAGLDVAGLRHTIFSLGAGVAGLAGALFLHVSSVVVPGDFGFLLGLPIVLNVVLGRLGANRSVAAAVAMYVLYEFIKLRALGLLGESAGEVLASWKDALLGIVLIVALRLQSIGAWWRRPRAAWVRA